MHVVLKTHAPPRPDDDVELLSLLLLSLETRQDLSQRVLQYTEAEHALNAIVRKCDSAEANAFDLAGRAKELQRHWRSFHSENRDANKDATGDVPYTAMKAAADAGKPADWKLELSEAAASDADNLFKAIRMEREHACSFFRRNTPTPMAWHPKDGEAWKTVDKRMLQTGQLHHSPHFTPIYMGFPLQAIDVSFTWKNPDWDDEQVAEYSKAKDFKRQFESTKGSYPLRSEDDPLKRYDAPVLLLLDDVVLHDLEPGLRHHAHVALGARLAPVHLRAQPAVHGPRAVVGRAEVAQEQAPRREPAVHARKHGALVVLPEVEDGVQRDDSLERARAEAQLRHVAVHKLDLVGRRRRHAFLREPHLRRRDVVGDDAPACRGDHLRARHAGAAAELENARRRGRAAERAEEAVELLRAGGLFLRRPREVRLGDLVVAALDELLRRFGHVVCLLIQLRYSGEWVSFACLMG
ncbi:cobalamin synthesis protein [Purpureocillium lavendulum]|uniref:Cobalamin synthesis protein n=1 Tax=Purpureocillium lavendulum TaxID=1247861 RepID=A0AB34FM39_9HYPO|nr:cobalamin synthesis protein [Purpureocillium lavendulum]